MHMRRPEEYCDALFSTAYTARLCPDVVLRAFGKAYPAHRVILASQSAYFSTLLRWVSWQPANAAGPGANTGELAEWSSIPSHEMVLGEDVTQEGFEWILEYFYASPHVAVTSDNAFDVLAAAHYLGVTAVQTACLEFLAQHLDPQNLAACLLWATRADHGEASDMLAASCRRLLALRLPSNLAAWAPALGHMEPRTLLDIMSSDHLAVPTEYDRYALVKQVANTICAAAEAAAATVAADEEQRVVRAGGAAVDRDSGGGGVVSSNGSLEIRRMLSSALRLPDEGLAGQLQFARSFPTGGLRPSGRRSRAPAAAPAAAVNLPSASNEPEAAPAAAPAADAASIGGALTGACDSSLPPDPVPIGRVDADGDGRNTGAVGPGMSQLESTCVESCSSVPAASQASGRSTTRLRQVGAVGGGAVVPSVAECSTEDGRPSGVDTPEAREAPPPPLQPRPAGDSDGGCDAGAAGPPTIDAPAATSATAAAAAVEAAAACAQLLLHEAVRYEHLTVPQLMAVEREGLVAPRVLNSALWERTRLDCKVHARTSTAAAATAATPISAPSHRRGSQTDVGDEAEAGARRGAAAGRGPPATCRLLDGAGACASWSGGLVVRPGLEPRQCRAFRVCWRLPCGALKKLPPQGTLQSELHQHAGALWQLRLCGSDRARDHLGVFVGRHLVTSRPCGQHQACTAAAGAATLAAGQQRRQNPDGPARVASPARQGGNAPAAAAAAAGGGDGVGGRAVPQQRRLPERAQQPRRQPHQRAAAAALAAEPAPFFAYTDTGAALRGRCRVSVFQSDNTALGGRLCLGDTGDFAADFAAGGYFGQSQLVSRCDVSRLDDELEILVFMALQVLED